MKCVPCVPFAVHRQEIGDRPDLRQVLQGRFGATGARRSVCLDGRSADRRARSSLSRYEDQATEVAAVVAWSTGMPGLCYTCSCKDHRSVRKSASLCPRSLGIDPLPVVSSRRKPYSASRLSKPCLWPVRALSSDARQTCSPSHPVCHSRSKYDMVRCSCSPT